MPITSDQVKTLITNLTPDERRVVLTGVMSTSDTTRQGLQEKGLFDVSGVLTNTGRQVFRALRAQATFPLNEVEVFTR